MYGNYFLGQTIGQQAGCVFGTAQICSGLSFVLAFWYMPDSFGEAMLKSIAVFFVAYAGGNVGWSVSSDAKLGAIDGWRPIGGAAVVSLFFVGLAVLSLIVMRLLW